MPDAAADLAAVLRPSDRPNAELTAGGGNYVRSAGSWLYAATGDPVPGAADLTLGQRYAAAPRVQRDEREYVLLDDGWLLGSQARPELGWCLQCMVRITDAHPSLTAAVPVEELAGRASVVVGLTAPELEAANLLTSSAIAHLLGVTRSTVNAYHSRGQMPPPALTLSRRLPLWPRPIIDHWMAGHTRRHRDG
ncbi:AlpA family transcriptional regulator [Haloactinopolyspora alba]|uniref:AlpA family transcriptional regulator n=1 Tax=Haloactinopolyspora alba TaxID=648780 RepID=A0A2P8DLV9_9ACTN|nr:hypothetical protein [Haloactinopolyspora alba]PSK98223.1 AlpA family transcriptional regulator [Haloactinopolyspora alba]